MYMASKLSVNIHLSLSCCTVVTLVEPRSYALVFLYLLIVQLDIYCTQTWQQIQLDIIRQWIWLLETPDFLSANVGGVTEVWTPSLRDNSWAKYT